MAALALVIAAGVGWFGWRFVARPAPIEDRMPMAAPAVSGGGVGVADDATPSAHATSSAQSGDEQGSGQGAPSTNTDPNSEPATVHVAGAVMNPGVVTLDPGKRVTDAVAAVGGLSPDADPDRINLAAPLLDGARIVVPRRGEEVPAEVPTTVAPAPGASVGGTGADQATSKVALNTATAEDLESLPGVGPATAAAILAYREENGPFRSVDDLLEVRGIGDAKLDAIRDLVTVP